MEGPATATMNGPESDKSMKKKHRFHQIPRHSIALIIFCILAENLHLQEIFMPQRCEQSYPWHKNIQKTSAFLGFSSLGFSFLQCLGVLKLQKT